MVCAVSALVLLLYSVMLKVPYPPIIVALTTALGVAAAIGACLCRAGTSRAPAAGPSAGSGPRPASSPAGLGTTGPGRPVCPQIIHS